MPPAKQAARCLVISADKGSLTFAHAHAGHQAPPARPPRGHGRNGPWPDGRGTARAYPPLWSVAGLPGRPHGAAPNWVVCGNNSCLGGGDRELDRAGPGQKDDNHAFPDPLRFASAG